MSRVFEKYKTSMVEIDRDGLKVELMKSTIRPAIAASAIIGFLELIFLVVNLIRPYHPMLVPGYLACYTVLLLASAAMLGVLLWAGKDLSARRHKLHGTEFAYAVILVLWASVVSRLDLARHGCVSPILLITVLQIIPICLYMHPLFYLIIETAACAYLLCLMSGSSQPNVTSDMINFFVYYICHSIVSTLYMFNRLYNTIRNLQKVAVLQHEKELTRELADINLKMANEARRIAVTDTLTGLGNRRAMMEEIQRLRDHHDPDLTVLQIDVNGLKQTNDKLGHEAGDELLCAVAQCLRDAFTHPTASLIRAGGDEFAVFLALPKEDLEGMLQRFSELLAAWKGTYISSPCVSVGVAALRDHPGTSVEGLIAAADEAMYQEKKKFYRLHPEYKRYHTERDA